jgi:predicted DNA-binding transcriptional regulator YafY
VRADRLVAIVLLLQTHGQLTAGDLAERLETSQRTIRRDLDSLSGAGVPVYAQRGRGGGWALLGGHKLDLSGLTAEEAQALFLVAGPNAFAGLGVEPGVRSALRKLLAALPASMREQAAAARAAVHVDPMAWGQRPPAATKEGPPHLETLRAAIVAGRQVVIGYAKPGETAKERRLHPYGLVSKAGTWYLLAGAEAGLRTFRVSRVRLVTITDDAVQRPDNFDLAEAWEGVQDSFGTRRDEGEVTVELRVDVDFVPWMRGWTRVDATHFRATFPNAAFAAAELARFGNRAEVVSPPEVRKALAQLGRDLARAYGA